jgi:Domain of unknown function (DUF1844)
MGASDEEPGKGFKIQDRRRFSAEGELKPEFRGGDEPGTQRSGATAEPSGAREPGMSKEYAGSAGPPRQTSAAASAGARSTPPAEISFSTFLMSLSTEALVHMGEIPDPAGGEHRRDLATAQHLIDIIGLLKEKTRGNLDPDEQGLLDAILFDLRMKYVEIARRVG